MRSQKTKLWLQALLSVLTASFLSLGVVQPSQAEEVTTAIIKEQIKGRGQVSLAIRIYDAETGGNLLLEDSKTVKIDHGQFVDTFGIPNRIIELHPQVFFEFAKSETPDKPLGEERMQFTASGGNSEFGTTAAATYTPARWTAVCYTCGGAFPRQVGAVATRSGGTNIQYWTGCSGTLANHTNDTRPMLCEMK